MVEIEVPNPARFIQVDGTSNFEHRSGMNGLPAEFNFAIDWDKKGEGQNVLFEHIASRSMTKVRWHGKQHQGVFKDEWGMNSSNGMVFFEVR